MTLAISNRAFLMAGVSLVSASAIALTSVSPLPDVQIGPSEVATQVALTATPASLVSQALENISTITLRAADDPAPIFTQIFSNGLTYAGQAADITSAFVVSSDAQVRALVAAFQTAVDEGDFGAIGELVGDAILLPASLALQFVDDMTPLVNEFADNLNDLLNVLPAVIVTVGNSLGQPILATTAALGQQIQVVVDALDTDGIPGALQAAAKVPVNVLDATINGFVSDEEEGTDHPGILTPGDGVMGDGDEGPIAAIQAAKFAIRDALIIEEEAPAPEAEARSAAPAKKLAAVSSVRESFKAVPGETGKPVAKARDAAAKAVSNVQDRAEASAAAAKKVVKDTVDSAKSKLSNKKDDKKSESSSSDD